MQKSEYVRRGKEFEVVEEKKEESRWPDFVVLFFIDKGSALHLKQ